LYTSCSSCLVHVQHPANIYKFLVIVKISVHIVNVYIYIILHTHSNEQVTSAPLPRWTQLSHRRLQTWPSALTKNNTLLACPLPTWLESTIGPRFKDLGIFNNAPHQAPNHVLVNEYQPGQGIMPHEDGAAYYPLVATVSLGAPIVFDIYEKHGPEQGQGQQGTGTGTGTAPSETARRPKPKYRILQERRSLLITRGEIYTDFLHGIAEVTKDEELGPDSICNWDLLREKEAYRGGWYERKTRISLTYRDVLHVTNMGNAMKFLGGR
jgi:alkylated DNA repair protein alkB family protein 6